MLVYSFMDPEAESSDKEGRHDQTCIRAEIFHGLVMSGQARRLPHDHTGSGDMPRSTAPLGVLKTMGRRTRSSMTMRMGMMMARHCSAVVTRVFKDWRTISRTTFGTPGGSPSVLLEIHRV